MTPVQLVIEPATTLRHVIEPELFTLRSEWGLSADVAAECHLVGIDDRKFPTIDISLIVVREPSFYVMNVVYPMGLFAFMSNMQFALPRYSTSDRFNLCFSLMLTSVAFKLSITTMLPSVSYLTVLDRFMMGCLLCIVLASMEAAAMGFALNYFVEQVMDDLSMGSADADNDVPGRALSLRHHYHGTNDEELLWELSRQGWARAADKITIVVNLATLGKICFGLYRRAANIARSHRQELRMNQIRLNRKLNRNPTHMYRAPTLT